MNELKKNLQEFIENKIDFLGNLTITDSIDAETLIEICEEYHKLKKDMKEIKEEAERIIERFKYSVGDIPECTQEERTKQCALICIENVISENKSVLEMLNIHGTLRNRIPVEGRISDLEEVKKYIEDNY